MADDVRNGAVDPEKDNMLKITNDGKNLALDQRLINEFLPDDENSKVNVCVRNVLSIWEKTKENKSTQLIFCDMSTLKENEASLLKCYPVLTLQYFIFHILQKILRIFSYEPNYPLIHFVSDFHIQIASSY